MSALSQLGKLTAEQKAILRSKTVKLNRSVDDLLALLEPIAEFDAAVENARTKAGCVVGFVLLLAFLLFVFGWQQRSTIHSGGPRKGKGSIRMRDTPSEQVEETGLLLAAGVLAAVALFIRVRVINPLKVGGGLSLDLGEVTIPFLRILREEVPAGNLIQIHIDLDWLETPKHLLPGKDPNEKKYLASWFHGQATFADGTRLQWRVVDGLRSRTRTRQGISGKTKTKIKRVLRSDVAVKLAFPSKIYSLLPGNSGDEKPAADDTPKRLSVSLKKTTKTTMETSTEAFQMLLDLIADGYRSVTARKGA